ncbi:Gfo/Idh/MocA family oxidoreductase [Bacillus sp. 31A1R]|uniref:Gfo/Idh/MocA family oxidoreductase n=1 Tax=Robertmurraya mangrovi TaxID=3098077 RepID=A0ABU5J0U1_9BACI|nr:Gfo/Idh/MocA family oxidoreductase [Bacillus sp. 31A1R]MDZ5472972.1 Gfo/Idh/MocA family oxidoreductase [Bacillus sp. 31A1R]
MKRKIKVGMVGIGAIGERVLRKFQYHSGVELVAVCDRNEERLNAVKEEFEDVLLYTDHLEMLSKSELDLVYVAVPPKFHHKIALDVLNKGINIFCEKPLANSLEEAKEMLEAALKANVIHAMNFPMIYSNVFQVLKEKIQKGEIGEVKKVEVNLHFTSWPRQWQKNEWIASREQGGFIREVAPHYIQMIYDIFGKISNVHSFVDYPENVELCETGFIAKMELANGIPVLFNGLSGIGQKEHLSFKVYGDQGTIDLTNWSQLTQSSADKPPVTLPIERTEQMDIVMELVKAIEGKPAVVVSFNDGYEVQKTLEEILKG